MATMRAKMVCTNVTSYPVAHQETLDFRAVYKEDGYDESGRDENNTFATFTPSADLTMAITNPDLIGKIKVGDTFYLDFIKAES